ncbi:MAG: DsbA family protein, partial [Candidatus Thiodiazotropha sp.]
MAHLYYIHDPMCSWCWAFRPAFADLLRRLPEGMTHSRLLGGLAPDSDQPMSEEMRAGLQATWRRIQEKLPETRFNFDF